MFTRTKDIPPLPALDAPRADASRPAEPQRKLPAKVGSLVASGMTFEGSLVSEGELHVDGVVRGDVRVGRLTLGEVAHVDGAITCDMAEIRGRVTGSVTARQVRLAATAHVEGDISHEQLSVEPGAWFEGRSIHRQRPAQTTAEVIELEARAVG